MSVSVKLLQSSGFMFFGRIFNRGVGLISTVILARVLTPDDFGVVAIATIVAFFFDAISNSGMKEYIVQKKQLSTQDLDTAWTLNLIVKLAVWLVFICAVPFIAEWYEKQELELVLWVVSLVLFFRAFENVGFYIYQRDLNYKPLFKLELLQRIISFVVLMLLLLIEPSYWVMVVSIVFTVFVHLIGTYCFHQHRPRFSIGNIEAQWKFSKWLLPKGMIGFLKSELDALIVSKFFGFSTLGGFNLMKSLTAMIGRDVIQPATDPLIAAFSRSKDDRVELNERFVKSVWILNLLIVPVVGFTANFSDLIILTLYGRQWIEFSPLLTLMSGLILVYSFTGVANSLLTSLGRVNALFWFELISLVVLVLVLMSIPLDSIETFAWYRVLVSVILVIFLVIFVQAHAPASLGRLLLLHIPLLVSVFTAVCVTDWLVELVIAHHVLMFLLAGMFFVLFYLVILACLMYPLRSVSEVGYLNWLVKHHLIRRLKIVLGR